MSDVEGEEIFSLQQKTKVRIHAEKIVIENPAGKFSLWSKKPIVIPFEFLLAVEVGSSDAIEVRSKNTRKVFDIQPTKGNTEDQLSVLYIHESGNHWSPKSITLKHENAEIVSKWHDKFNLILHNQKLKRPKKLLVFINPFGGKGQAWKINESIIQPLFRKCHIESQVLITERPNHAIDVLKTCDLNGIDGVICIGGDGMFNEIFNGLFIRTNFDHGLDLESDNVDLKNLIKPSIRVGVIPGGSTDAVAMTLHGTSDVLTSALHIIIGDKLEVDISSLCTNGKFQRFSSMVSYGYLGDLMKRSEKCRWMGPNRYDIAGVRTFLGNRGYRGFVSYIEAVNESQAANVHDKCQAGCQKCQQNVQSTLEEKGYKKGKFSAITGACTNCASRFTPQGLSPGAHLSDGLLDLILVSRTSRFNYLRYLYRSGYLRDSPFDLPFVQRLKVKEFTFVPDLKAKSSVWNCDGEVLNCTEINVKVHCKSLPVFARGPNK